MLALGIERNYVNVKKCDISIARNWGIDIARRFSPLERMADEEGETNSMSPHSNFLIQCSTPTLLVQKISYDKRHRDLNPSYNFCLIKDT